MRSNNRAAAESGKSEGFGDAFQEVIRLEEQGDLDAANRLQEIAGDRDKALSKAARRALYNLKITGIEPAANPSPQIPPSAPVRNLTNRALLTQFGGTGSRMLIFVRDDPHGGSPTLVSFLINDERGLLDLGSRKLSRRQVEENIASFSSKEGNVVAGIDLDYARFLLKDAADLSVKLRRPLPKGYSALQSQIGEPETVYEASPVFGMLNGDHVRADLSISRSPEALLEQPWFRGWLVDLKDLAPWVEKLIDASESRLVLDDAQKNQRAERVADDAADALLTEEALARWRRRLEDSAMVLHRAGCPQDAAEAFYQALSLQEVHTAHLAPFARAMVKRSFNVALAMLQKEEEPAQPPPGLIERI